MAENEVVRAAGGVVWKPRPDGAIEVLVVHRPHYDDWSLPKGKRDPGEDDETCARREVEEETGLRCRLGAELASTSYVDRKGRPKVVRYWAMTPETGEVTAANEVDDARWVGIEEAQALLSYPRDRQVLASLLASMAEAG
ncbi:MAG TPA: NUDIX hydrolase [Acidimicrobiales bacterium]|nr:NUDIX hydrolase [Acidimicrobiales bacterium]